MFWRIRFPPTTKGVGIQRICFMKKIIMKDMQIRVRKESDKSRGWIRISDLLDTIVESIIEVKNGKK